MNNLLIGFGIQLSWPLDTSHFTLQTLNYWLTLRASNSTLHSSHLPLQIPSPHSNSAISTNTLQTPRFSLHAPQSTLQASHFTFSSQRFALHTAGCTLLTTHLPFPALHSPPFTISSLQISHFIRCKPYFPLCAPPFTLNTSHSSLATPQCLPHIPHHTLPVCTALSTPHSTLHTSHSAPS